MSDTVDLGLTYTGVSLSEDGCAAVICIADELADKNVDHAYVYMWINDDWSVFKTPNAIVSTCWPLVGSAETHCLAADGTIISIFEDSNAECQIDTSDEGPSDLVNMKDMRVIDGQYFVVGMARRAYVAAKPQGKWRPIDSTCFVPRAKRKEVMGFTSVDGFSASDVYAVGYNGEIWHYDGKAWSLEPSPTNVLLSRLVCDRSSGLVWAVGLKGTIVSGRQGAWKLFGQKITKADLWGLVSFKGKLLASSDAGVFEMKDDTLEPVRIGTKGPTTSYLASNGSEVWSVGDKDIFRSEDAKKWTRVPAP